MADLGPLGLEDGSKRPRQAVSAGFQHCLAISRSGAVYSWGNARHGRLGRELLTHFDATPRLVDVPYAKHVSAGGAHSALIASKGLLLLCGDNRSGQLGRDRATEQCAVFREVPVAARLAECGRRHTLCLTFDGLLVGFGANGEGEEVKSDRRGDME